MKRIQNEYFEDLYNVGAKGWVTFSMCYVERVRKCNYFRLKLEKRRKGYGDRRISNIFCLELCKIVFESGVVSED